MIRALDKVGWKWSGKVIAAELAIQLAAVKKVGLEVLLNEDYRLGVGDGLHMEMINLGNDIWVIADVKGVQLTEYWAHANKKESEIKKGTVQKILKWAPQAISRHTGKEVVMSVRYFCTNGQGWIDQSLK